MLCQVLYGVSKRNRKHFYTNSDCSTTTTGNIWKQAGAVTKAHTKEKHKEE